MSVVCNSLSIEKLKKNKACEDKSIISRLRRQKKQSARTLRQSYAVAHHLALGQLLEGCQEFGDLFIPFACHYGMASCCPRTKLAPLNRFCKPLYRVRDRSCPHSGLASMQRFARSISFQLNKHRDLQTFLSALIVRQMRGHHSSELPVPT